MQISPANARWPMTIVFFYSDVEPLSEYSPVYRAAIKF